MKIASQRLALLLLLSVVPLAAASDIPLVESMPGCRHDKLGTVAVVEGTDVSKGTSEMRVAPASYEVAMRRLADAARERGANVLVLRDHQAMFFTKARGSSRRPVHVRLRAAAIRVGDLAACTLEPLSMEALQRRAIEGEAEKVIAEPGAPTG